MTKSFRLSFRLAAGAACAAATLSVAPAAWADRYAAIVVDASTNEVLHSDQADAIRYPASLTKMMTLYMLFEAMERGEIRLSDTIEASRRAQNQPPSRLGLRAGDRLTVEQAIGALVTRSANDVAVAVAERLEGSEARFAQRMTAKARQLGMRDTRYVNASGLPDPNQITTARDILALSQALLRDYPQNYRYFQTAEFSWRNVYSRNHNGLLGRVEGVDGIKTGYTRMSGFNLASSAQRNGHRIFAVVMGGESAASRDAQMAYLIDAAFQQIDAKTGGRPVPPMAVYTSLPVTRVTVTPPVAAPPEPEDMAEVAVAANGAALAVTVEQGSADQPSYVVPVPFMVRPVSAIAATTPAPAAEPAARDLQIRGSNHTESSSSGESGGRD
ncbi:MAG: D-alanyl-D-alanine carboxypeptidase [Hyphomonadaceae bacterium]|nr:MAG: D-alanyl-D-alanine carboxypeptidase [Caulobacteraceae bacterium]MBT9445423.1 D-alanyl-D-alanine carboxypeptidase [Hyphomonadaceae bacterium]TPW07000.1 MAG: D-alanyl-D-alanine carboxypeptidase [Alphaproteobacteria bacterium]